MSNLLLAHKTLSLLKEMGASSVCICAGARNSPFVELLSSRNDFEKFNFFDERAAGFFALGRIKLTQKPVAVITTSGTAAGELLPAMMEAYYSHLLLVAITADRPRNYRSTGAPQAAEQVGLYGIYSQPTIDIDENFKECIELSAHKPIHLNICFDEPLPGPALTGEQLNGSKNFKYKKIQSTLDLNQCKSELNSFLKQYKNVFTIVGGLNLLEAKAVYEFLSRSNLPYYAEAQSQMREMRNENQFLNIDNFFSRSAKSNFEVDALLRIGDVPTHRLWRDLDKMSNLPILSVSSKSFSGMPRGKLICAPLGALLSEIDFASHSNYLDFKKEDESRQKNIEELLNIEPQSEPGIFRKLSMQIPENTHLYLGNSLPIREWDFAAQVDINKKLIVDATRGLNGIDGQVSYFMGMLQEGSWAILGDLTTLYDMQGFWPLNQLKKKHFKVFVVNNGGGKIFENIFNKKDYYNSHSLKFNYLAQMWSLKYEEFNFNTVDSQSQLIEVFPSQEATQRFWKRYKAL